MTERMMTVFSNLGFQNNGATTFEGHPATEFIKEVGYSSRIKVILDDKGFGRVFKPNGTKKTICQKTPAQLATMLKQIEDFYKI